MYRHLQPQNVPSSSSINISRLILDYLKTEVYQGGRSTQSRLFFIIWLETEFYHLRLCWLPRSTYIISVGTPPSSYIERAINSQTIGACFDIIRQKPNWYLGGSKKLRFAIEDQVPGFELLRRQSFCVLLRYRY